MERRGEAFTVDAGGAFFNAPLNLAANSTPITPRTAMASVPAHFARAWDVDGARPAADDGRRA